jgi:hypothetical protein
VKSFGGNIAVYVQGNLEVGQSVEDIFYFLQGLSINDGGQVMLSGINVTPEIYADIHVISTEDGLWIIFLDASSETKRALAMQQKANEANLLQEQIDSLNVRLKEAMRTISQLRDKLESNRET